ITAARPRLRPEAGRPASWAGRPASGLPFDQRGTGFPRVQGLGADIGAFEVQDGSPGNLTVTNLNDSGSGSLRHAIITGNGVAGPNTVVFQSGLTGNIP